MNFIYFAVGLYFLIKGADLLTDGAASLASQYNLNHVIVGLTIMAFGTSAPELFVTISSIIKGSSEILLGNIFGSSVLNVFLVLGLASILGIVNVHKRLVKLEIPFSLLVCLLLFFGLNDSLFNPISVNQLGVYDGLILLSLFSFFMWTIFNYKEGFFEHKPVFISLSKSKTFIYLFLGLIFLMFGSFQVVDSGLKISDSFGLSQTLIGALFISLGTSLPEIVTSFSAFKKKNNELMIGNIVGSNLFNLLFVLGIASVFSPITYDSTFDLHLYTMIFAQLILFVSLFFNRKKILSKYTGFLFVIFYITYLFLNFV